MQMIGRRPSLSAFVEESFSFKLFRGFRTADLRKHVSTLRLVVCCRIEARDLPKRSSLLRI